MPSDGVSAHISTENIVVSTIVTVIGISGLLSNGAVIISVLFNSQMRNSFGVLCLSHAVANIGVMLICIFWLTPTTIMATVVTDESFGKVMGQLNIMFWDVSVYSHLTISLNRVVAIIFPYHASELLSTRNTFIAVAVVWCLGFFHATPYFWTDTCYIYYDNVQWVWMFGRTICGYILSIYIDNFTCLIVLVVILLLDITTYIKLRQTNKAMNNQRNGSSVSQAEHQRRRQMEAKLFIQALYQNVLFLYEIASSYYIATFFQSQWALFFTTTFAWEVCHAFDGFMVILYNFHFSFIGSLIRNSGAVLKKRQRPTTIASTTVWTI